MWLNYKLAKLFHKCIDNYEYHAVKCSIFGKLIIECDKIYNSIYVMDLYVFHRRTKHK